MPLTTSTMLLLRTVRHLRAGQLVGQLRHRLGRAMEHPERLSQKKIPRWEGCRRRPTLEFLPPGPQTNTADDLSQGRMTFLHREEKIGWPPKWDCPHRVKLWQYNLHYFEYLWAWDYGEARRLVSDWIASYPLQRNRIGWDSYPTSLRLVNWCCTFFGRWQQQTEADRSFRDLLWQSIVLQAEWLSRHLETHLLGNHLFENGAALATVGCCFHGREARRLRRLGFRILRRELEEQMLSDGGHFERSPMYHSRILYLLLLLLNPGDAELTQLVRPYIGKAQEALSAMCHPDGRIALLNDSAFGIYNEPGQLFDYAGRLLSSPEGKPPPRPGNFALNESGYYGARSDNGNYIICDAGPIGPDYLPGHAHGDIFSFELSLSGHRVVVDSGVYGYERDRMRRYCRSTAAHNTVEIDGRDQCEFWAAFRVARRGRPHDVSWTPTQQGFRLSGWHDGYDRLKGRPRHAREITWDAAGLLHVRDTVTCTRSVRAISRLHLHPSCRLRTVETRAVTVDFPGGSFRVDFSGSGKLHIGKAHYCPEFGMAVENEVLEFEFAGEKPTASFCVTSGVRGTRSI